MKQLITLTAAALLSFGSASAQMANGCSKFLGNITTTDDNWQEQCDWSPCRRTFTDYWNQVTCENATKWGSVNSGRGRFNWTNADRTYNYCKQHGIIFKYHALIWGSQHPTWIESLSVNDTKTAIVEWFDEVQKHYPDLTIIDVVNEAIYSGGDYHSPYKQTKIIEALGSLAEDRAERETGRRPSYNCNTNGYPNTNSYQWLAEAFRMARERWPNAILIYNDYNTFQWQKTEFINLVNGIKACGGPIDAAGNQAHDLNDMSGSQFKSALEEIHNKTQLPQYITEYDICKKNDATFETRYKEQFPIMWEADYVAGVTLWGWIYGKTWVNDGNGDDGKGASGLVRNCQDRSAFTWLQNYMKSDAAKNAKAPSIGGPTVNVTLTVSTESIEAGEKLTFNIKSSATKDIDHLEIYINDELFNKSNSSTYEGEYTPTEAGKLSIKVIGYDKEGNKKEASKNVTVCSARKAFGSAPVELPGTIEMEDFDLGCEGISFKDSDNENEGAAEEGGDDYRKDGSGVDIVKLSNGGHAIGYTAADEWLEYTVNVRSGGNYTYEAVVAAGNGSAKFHLALKDGQKYSDLTDVISIPEGSDWTTYTSISGKLLSPLQEGEQVIRVAIDGPYGNIDKITFTCTDCTTGIEEINFFSENATFQVYTTTGSLIGTLTVDNASNISKSLKDLTKQEGAFIVRNIETGEAKLILSRE